MYNKNPNIKQMKLELDLIGLEKEAEPVSAGIGAAILTGGATLLAGAAGAAAEGIGSIASAGAQALDAIGDLGMQAVPWAIGGAAGTGLAAAYLAHKMKKLNPSDIDLDRSEYYKQNLKTRISEIRNKQAIEAKQRSDRAKEPSLRLS